jgi:hypothetical protein
MAKKELTMAAEKRVPKAAKKGASRKSSDLLELGTRVKIRHSSGMLGRIVELRGPLGPDGAHIYLVRVWRKPKPRYIELRGDQLLPVAVEK